MRGTRATKRTGIFAITWRRSWGWKRAEGYDDRWEHPVSHVAHLAGDGYTCDDMLVWLVQRCEAVETKTWPGRSDVMLWSSANGWPDEHTAPTLHAALEAAVLTVGQDRSN